MVKLYSVTGVDGSGKSTLMNRIQAKEDNLSIKGLKVPQYYETQGTLFSKEVEILERIGKFGDSIKNPFIKVNATYLQFCLFGKVVQGLSQSVDTVICERFPILDGIALAKFYTPLLQKGCDPQIIKKEIINEFSPEELELVVNIIPGKDLYSIHRYIVEICEKSFGELFARLEQDFETKLPQKLVQLKASQELLASRIEDSTGVKEAHEKVPVLMMMQESLVNDATNLASEVENFSFYQVQVDGKCEEEVEQEVLKLLDII